MLFSPVLSEGQVIAGPEVRLANNDIYVSFSLNLEDKNLEEIRRGIDKELKIYIDLFKVWKVWPDEFVLGKTYTRTLKADPIKKEYVSTSLDGNTLIERRFKSFESMIKLGVVGQGHEADKYPGNRTRSIFREDYHRVQDPETPPCYWLPLYFSVGK